MAQTRCVKLNYKEYSGD